VARLICPACTAPSLSFDAQGILACPYCGTRIVGESHVCPVCKQINPPEAEQCLKCGEPLTMTARVVLRHMTAARQPLFLEQARGMAAGLKSKGDLASEERMDRFREIDRKRESQDAKELARREMRDRKLLLVSAGAVAVLLMAILLGFLLTIFR
jgi:DNA-directed RNA polymerase subunit RPC12/RpoP